MHKLYELKDMLCEELEQYGEKDKLDVGSLDVVDKLAHAVKNIDKILEGHEEEYSSNMGRSYRYDRSYAGRRRDAMGRYSRAEGDFMADLKEIMHDAPNDRIRAKIKGIMDEL